MRDMYKSEAIFQYLYKHSINEINEKDINKRIEKENAH